MRRAFATVVVLGLAAQGALAQDPAKIEAEKANVPKHKCGDLPVWPGKMAAEAMRRAFETNIKNYGDCIRLYLDDRRASIKAHELVAKSLIEEYNDTLDGQRRDLATGSKPEVK